MTPHYTTPEPWRDVLEAILGSRPTANQYFRYETVPHLAVTRLYYELGPDVAAQQALSAAVFQLLDETIPSRQNVTRLFHLIRTVGAVKPAMGLNLLQKLLRENTFWHLKQDDVVLHTLLLSMAGEYVISPSFAEWIRADCSEKSDFDYTLVGFSAIANQEISRVALWLLEQAIDLAANDSQRMQLGRELMGLSHPYADLYHWIRDVRANNPILFGKARHILGDFFLEWTDQLAIDSEPYKVLLTAEIFAGIKPFAMQSVLTIAAKEIEVGVEHSATIIDTLYAAQRWRTNPSSPQFPSYLHIEGESGDVVFVHRIAEPRLFALLARTVEMDTDPKPRNLQEGRPQPISVKIPIWQGPQADRVQ